MSTAEKPRALVPLEDFKPVYGINYTHRHIRRLAAKGTIKLIKIAPGRNARLFATVEDVEALARGVAV